jgi:RimJ/RimL family protein N-acetyltransferase
MSAISLRNHESSDAADVFEINSDPLVQTFLGGVKSHEETKNGFEYVLNNFHRFKYPLRAIVHNGENKVIGYCAMQPLKGIGFEIYFGLNSKYWGKGYCRQAVLLYLEKETLGVEKVFATVDPDNVKSQRLLESTGFEFEKEIFYEPLGKMHRLYARTWKSPAADAFEPGKR